MGNLHLVTGHAGTAHVTAADHASLNAAIFGEGQYVLDRGSKFATTIISNNSIRIADGDLLMQGRHIRLNEGSYVDLVIENGTQGFFRNDLIVARYTKDSLSGVEDCNLVVIKGTAVAASATDPEYTAGDIINGHVLLADMPLYRVPLDGLNVQTLVPLFEEASLLADGSVTNSKLADKSVSTAKLGDGVVTTAKLGDGAVTTAKLGSNSVTTAKIADANVTKAKLAAGATHSTATATLAVASWSSQKQTVSVSGVTASNTVIVVAAPASHTAYTNAGVYCSAQAAGKLTFTCTTTPTAALTVNVLILA